MPNVSWVTILWAMAAAAALTLASIHFGVWLRDRKSLPNLLFCVIAVSVAAIARTEVGMMHSATPEEYGRWVRWFHPAWFFAVIGLLLFVKFYLGTGRMWLAWAIIAIRCFVVVGNFGAAPNFTFREIRSLVRGPFLGEHVAAPGEVILNPWQWLPTLSVILFIIFVADATITLWRKGEREGRRKAVVVGGSTLAYLVLAIGQSQLIVWGLISTPIMLSPPFVLMMAAMGWELSRDLTLTKQALRETEELRRELAHAGRVTLLGQLAAALAHELSQPLGAILRNCEAADLILKRADPDLNELRAIVDDIHKDDQRAGAVIDRLRALLKRRSLESRPIVVAELVQDVLTLVRSDAAARRVTLECSMGPNLPAVTGDRVHLSQVLLNLIINGMDAMNDSRDGGRRILISARSGSDHSVEVSVADSGSGISPQVLNKIFDPFMTTKPTGMGMGLPVSRTIVEAHGGRIWAESSADRGTVFRFTLPVADRGLQGTKGS